jgi:hypothetical protein
MGPETAFAMSGARMPSLQAARKNESAAPPQEERLKS